MKKATINGREVKLEIWDTGGQERFHTIVKSYYARAMGVLLVYDSTDVRSFLEIRNWSSQLHAHARKDILSVLVSTKCDLPDQKVSSEEGQALAKEFGIKFFETSSKTNLNVAAPFLSLASEAISKGLVYKVV